MPKNPKIARIELKINAEIVAQRDAAIARAKEAETLLQEAREAWKADIARLQAIQQLGSETGPHKSPMGCPTYYDGCNCTVENLLHNIERAEAAEAERDKLRAALEEAHITIERLQGRASVVRGGIETINHAIARIDEIADEQRQQYADLWPPPASARKGARATDCQRQAALDVEIKQCQ